MANFLKIGNSRQNYETDKALGKAGDFDVNEGEVVEVSFDASDEATASHRIADPIGAIPIRSVITPHRNIDWEATPNTLTVTLDGSGTGSMKFLVY